MMKKYKSRKITFIEFFDNLQREYIVAELRSKIYSNEKDKKYYIEREMAGKRQKIEDISAKNNLDNIFSSSFLKCKFYEEIYNKTGLPNFIYRDDLDKSKRGVLDVYNYFSKGTLVNVLYNDCCLKGKVISVDIKLSTVSVDVFDLERIVTVDFDNIVRYDLL